MGNKTPEADLVNKDNYLAAEARLLAFSGLEEHQIRKSDVEIYEDCTIRTIEVGFQETKTLDGEYK